MLDRKKERIFSIQFKHHRDMLYSLLKDMDGVSDIRWTSETTLTARMTGRAFSNILSHIEGLIYCGRVSISNLYPGRHDWTVDQEGRIVEV